MTAGPVAGRHGADAPRPPRERHQRPRSQCALVEEMAGRDYSISIRHCHGDDLRAASVTQNSFACRQHEVLARNAIGTRSSQTTGGRPGQFAALGSSRAPSRPWTASTYSSVWPSLLTRKSAIACGSTEIALVAILAPPAAVGVKTQADRIAIIFHAPVAIAAIDRIGDGNPSITRLMSASKNMRPGRNRELACRFERLERVLVLWVSRWKSLTWTCAPSRCVARDADDDEPTRSQWKMIAVLRAWPLRNGPER